MNSLRASGGLKRDVNTDGRSYATPSSSLTRLQGILFVEKNGVVIAASLSLKAFVLWPFKVCMISVLFMIMNFISIGNSDSNSNSSEMSIGQQSKHEKELMSSIATDADLVDIASWVLHIQHARQYGRGIEYDTAACTTNHG